MLNLTDLDEWFVCLCQEKDTWCCCSAVAPICYNCSRFDYIKEELQQVSYFGRDAVLLNEIRRLIKWQIHSNYEHPNRKF